MQENIPPEYAEYLMNVVYAYVVLIWVFTEVIYILSCMSELIYSR